MVIVVDTNVVISGIFFGGAPKQILDAVIKSKVVAYVTPEIIDEYLEIIEEMIARKQGHLNKSLLEPLVNSFQVIEPVTNVAVSRDPDDDKFIGCAKDSQAMYIVSGDKDLLVLKQYENIKIITARDFCDRYLSKA